MPEDKLADILFFDFDHFSPDILTVDILMDYFQFIFYFASQINFPINHISWCKLFIGIF